MKIVLNRNAVYETMGVRLAPGENEILKRDFDRLMKNKQFAAELEAGWFTVHKNAPKKQQPEPEPDNEVTDAVNG
jgi:hypothetical protein